jgi:hypothetical protein
VPLLEPFAEKLAPLRDGGRVQVELQSRFINAFESLIVLNMVITSRGIGLGDPRTSVAAI